LEAEGENVKNQPLEEDAQNGKLQKPRTNPITKMTDPLFLELVDPEPKKFCRPVGTQQGKIHILQ
jgi:hypothetical protein